MEFLSPSINVAVAVSISLPALVLSSTIGFAVAVSLSLPAVFTGIGEMGNFSFCICNLVVIVVVTAGTGFTPPVVGSLCMHVGVLGLWAGTLHPCGWNLDAVATPG